MGGRVGGRQRGWLGGGARKRRPELRSGMGVRIREHLRSLPCLSASKPWTLKPCPSSRRLNELQATKHKLSDSDAERQRLQRDVGEMGTKLQWLQRAATDGSVLARGKCECMPVARACMTLIEFDMPRDAREVGGRLCVRPDCRWYGRPAHSARTTY